MQIVDSNRETTARGLSRDKTVNKKNVSYSTINRKLNNTGYKAVIAKKSIELNEKQI